MSNSASNLPARRKKFSARDIFATFGVYALLIFMALLVLTPIVWIIGASFNPMSSLLSATAFPENPTVLHYVKLIKETKFVYWYANTLKIALINMAISVVLTSMTSYVFSRFRFKGKRAGAAVDTHIADVPQLHGHDGHLQHTLAAEPPGHALRPHPHLRRRAGAL